MTTGEGGLVVSSDPDARAADPALREQGLAVRRDRARSRVPRAQLAHERAAGRGRQRAARQARRRRSRNASPWRTSSHATWPACRASRRRSCATTMSQRGGSTRCTSTRQSIPGGPAALAAELRVGGIASAPRYIQKPAFACRVFTEQRTFGDSRWPFTLARPEALDYAPERFPGTFAFLDSVLVLPWNERYEVQHVELLGAAIRDAAARCRGRRG